MELQRQISLNLRREILLSGKTKSEIADAIGVSRPTLSQYLSGRALPSLATLSRLCDFLEISAYDILKVK